MKKEKLYLYLGTNGTILSPVYLPDAYSVTKLQITAEDGKKLKNINNNNTCYFTTIPENELSDWKEIVDDLS